MSGSDDLAKRVQELETENRRLKTALSDLEKSYDITLQALGDALDLKTVATEGHARRVTTYTIAIARKMGLSKEEISPIARGAFLHDIGKMAIPDAILLKPGKLADDEMAIMREHCYRGYKIISRIPFLTDVAEIVHAHHERYDGLGYPRGLMGKQISVGARLVAVANTLDSITSDLPYALRKRLKPPLKKSNSGQDASSIPRSSLRSSKCPRQCLEGFAEFPLSIATTVLYRVQSNCGGN